MKKLLALLLVLTMIFSMMAVLSGCWDDSYDSDSVSDEEDKDDDKKGDEDPDTKPEEDEPQPTETEPEPEPQPLNDVIGTWVYKMDMTELINSALLMAIENADLSADIDISQYISIDAYVMEMSFEFDNDGNAKMIVSAKEANKALVPDLIGDLEAMLEAMGMTVEQFEEKVGTSLETYVESFAAQHLTAEEEITEYQYKVEDGKIYLNEDGNFTEADASAYEIEDNTLIIEILDGVVFQRA